MARIAYTVHRYKRPPPNKNPVIIVVGPVLTIRQPQPCPHRHRALQ
jgi:hypothetical protein